jgi:uncharacterized protein YggT (Ycf19 family)
MGIVDFILNLAGLSLWLSWCSARLDPLARRPSASTLIGTLKRAEPRVMASWYLPAGLVILLVLRGVLYYEIGPAVDWNPSIELGAIAVPFRSQLLGRILLFSFVSFGVLLWVVYSWLLLLPLLVGETPPVEPVNRLVAQHLGPLSSLPAALKALLPWFLSAMVWFGASFVLVQWKLIPAPLSFMHRVEQSMVLGMGVYLALKYFLGTVLFLYLLSSYIYLGNHFCWDFVAAAGQRLTTPLRRLPLRVGKVDFAPVLLLAILFLVAQWLERGLTLLYEHLPL